MKLNPLILVFFVSVFLSACESAIMSAEMREASEHVYVLPPGASRSLRARVTVENEQGTAVSGAQLTAQWSGPINLPVMAMTDGAGMAVFTSPRTSVSGVYTFKLLSITKANAIYDPQRNSVSEVRLRVQ
jgi:hypothetical protein